MQYTLSIIHRLNAEPLNALPISVLTATFHNEKRRWNYAALPEIKLID